MLLLFLLISCSKQPQNELFIISPHQPEIRKEFGRAFERWYEKKVGRPIAVRWLDVGGTGEAVAYIESRNKGLKTGSGVDLFFGGGDIPYMTLKKAGLLQKLTLADSIWRHCPASLNGIALRDPDSLWIGAALSSFGIVINKEVLRRNQFPVPKTWTDLASPVYHGWVALADPRYAGTMHMMFEIILQSEGWVSGWQTLQAMTANARPLDKGAATAAKMVAQGQAAVGLSIDFYAAAEIDRLGEKNIGLVLPLEKTVVTADGIAILKGAPNLDAATLFVQFVMNEGQRLWMLRKGVEGGPVTLSICRMAADTTLYSLPDSLKAVAGNPFGVPRSFYYDNKLASLRWNLLNDLFASLLTGPHPELRRFSKSQFPDVPLSEDEASILAKGWGKGTRSLERIEHMNRWQKAALNNLRKE